MKEEIIYEKLRQRLSKAIDDGESQNGIAKLTDVKQATVWRFLKGLTSLSGNNLIRLLDYVGADIVFDERKDQVVDYDLVPKHAARAGAGASLETSDEMEGLYAFRKDWMASQGIHVKNAVLLDVVGDSMEPLLHEGDSLLIDKQDTEIRDGKIYVVTLGDELRVKRVYKGINGLILRSENPRYPDVQVTGPDLETFVVHGRVKWCGKIL